MHHFSISHEVGARCVCMEWSSLLCGLSGDSPEQIFFWKGKTPILSALVQEIDEEGSSDGGSDDPDREFGGKEQCARDKIRIDKKNTSC